MDVGADLRVCPNAVARWVAPKTDHVKKLRR